VVLRYDGLCFAQRSKPPLNLEVFISSNAFYNSPFFYKQLEFTRPFFVLIANNFIQSRREIDTTGWEPIMFYNTLMRFWTSCNLSHV
jgi:hypothetical protein